MTTDVGGDTFPITIDWCTAPRTELACPCSRRHRSDEIDNHYSVTFTDQHGTEVGSANGFCEPGDAHNYAISKLRNDGKKRAVVYAAAHIYQCNTVKTFDRTVVMK